jgi:hypothetical protein
MIVDAEDAATGEVLCFVNADIVILPAFVDALRSAMDRFEWFLLSSRRWDLGFNSRIVFGNGWGARMASCAQRFGRRHRPTGIDLFAYRGVRYGSKEPGFAYARRRFDSWMVWQVLHDEIPFMDAGGTLLIHQDHPMPAYHNEDLTIHEEMMRNRRIHDEATGGEVANFSKATWRLEDGEWRQTKYGKRLAHRRKAHR